MIRFESVEEPPGFDAQCRQPGLKWLETHPDDGRPRDYWTSFKPQLADGFRNLCGYSCMYEPVGTVDHFLSCRDHKSRAYDWDNYRFASGWVNSSKKDAEGLLDPFEVSDDWFEVLLPSLQLVPTERVPPAQSDRVHYTLRRLHLRDDERVIRQRQQWYQLYCSGELTLAGLDRVAPLIARAVRKQEDAKKRSQ